MGKVTLKQNEILRPIYVNDEKIKFDRHLDIHTERNTRMMIKFILETEWTSQIRSKLYSLLMKI